MKDILINYIESLYKDDMSDNDRSCLVTARMEADSLSDEQCKALIEDKFPFLIDKERMRDRVEGVMITTLTRERPTDVEVSYLDYCSVLGQLEGLIHNLATERLVLGFTPEDLESFMQMKVYQVLRRGQYDTKRKAVSFFQFVFRNLINDINKCKNSALKSCDIDAMVDCLDYNNIKGSDFLEES